ncbi:ATP-binding protein [Pseudofrankia sp. BMG5.37]|uniref:ATP-binding protein n=1 Tax=Pseudofrankia sp. BMG5.37 TaxID=3050035 RepID=UPI002894B2BE|nr:ATP-binding protein [Pseudofrankia sp. BMG5.37]MDT3444465.1 ATP-binding protein [Pseudofrankia sp. BMG5.37]
MPAAPTPRRRPHRYRRGRPGPTVPLTLPWDIATTAHLCALHPFSIETGLGQPGPLLGTDRLAGGAFHFDLVTAYEHGLIQGPNMVISGAGAHGKSALAKTYLHRTTALTTQAGRRRWTAVLDPKGEWTTLGHHLGYAVLRLQPGGTLRVNPLDTTATAPPSGGHRRARAPRDVTGAHAADSPTGPEPEGVDDLVAGLAAQRAAVLEALLAVALDRPTLDPSQHRLLVETARRLTTHTGAIPAGPNAPTLHHVRQLLAHPDHTLAADLDTTLDELLDRRRPLLDATVTLLDHDLRGIADGPTTPGLDWRTAPGLILDLSALLTSPRALKLVLTAATGWLAAVMHGQPATHKLTIVDEAWIALDDPAIARHLHNQWRLGRQFGQVNILITHAIADLNTNTGTGRGGAGTAEGLLNTTSVRVYLHQNPEHITRLLAHMGLTTPQSNLLDHLPPFTAIWQIGPHTALVDHSIAPDEWTFADTDTAMTSQQ